MNEHNCSLVTLIPCADCSRLPTTLAENKCWEPPNWKEETGSTNLYTAYAKSFLQSCDCDPRKQMALSYLNGQIVVDLGAGYEPWGYVIAHAGKAVAYIGVEPFYPDELAREIAHTSILPQPSCWDPPLGEARLPWTVVAQDMLRFVKRLPDESVSYLRMGIDSIIISANQDYWVELAQHINRTLHPAGAVVESGMGYPVHYSPANK